MLSQCERVKTLRINDWLRPRIQAEMVLDNRIEAGKPFQILLLGPDNFRSINDRWGHRFGDAVLEKVGALLTARLNEGDFVFRWAGDQFLMILNSDSANDNRAAQIASDLGRMTFYCVGPKAAAEVSLNLSIGVAEYRPGEDIEQFYERVEAAMYDAKALRSTPEADYPAYVV